MSKARLDILIPLETPVLRQVALESTLRLFGADSARLRLLRVVPAPSSVSGSPANTTEEVENWHSLMCSLARHDEPGRHPVYQRALWSAFREELTVRLAPDLLELRDSGFSVDLVLRRGDAAAEILRHAHETSSDLIVMGTHARTGLGRVLDGSVAESVVRRADVPVLIVQAGAEKGR